MKRQSSPGTTLAEKVAKYTERDPATGCLNWTAGLSHGYGQHQTPGHSSKHVHTSVWEMHNGPRPPGRVVRHRCHNPRCCEVTHLALGSPADNTRDKVEAGRQARGSAMPHTKLTDEQVIAIREDRRPLRTIAADYGIHIQTAYRVRKRLRREHV